MTKRIISALILMLILIPVIMVGGLIFDIAIYLVSLFALKEFLEIKEEKKPLPNFVKIVCYALNILIIFEQKSLTFTVDFRIIAGLFLILLIPIILYNDKSIYSVNDAFYLIGGLSFLSMSFSSIILIRNFSLNHFIYLILITTLTDTYSYFGGYLIGKHKLISISPNKTWEGTIVGTVFCTVVASLFYINIIDSNMSYINVVLLSLLLSIIGQFGDLIFSSIKRYFNKKDFSNLIPGHGGILDRLDSIIFVSLAFMFVMSYL